MKLLTQLILIFVTLKTPLSLGASLEDQLKQNEYTRWGVFLDHGAKLCNGKGYDNDDKSIRARNSVRKGWECKGYESGNELLKFMLETETVIKNMDDLRLYYIKALRIAKIEEVLFHYSRAFGENMTYPNNLPQYINKSEYSICNELEIKFAFDAAKKRASPQKTTEEILERTRQSCIELTELIQGKLRGSCPDDQPRCRLSIHSYEGTTNTEMLNKLYQERIPAVQDLYIDDPFLVGATINSGKWTNGCNYDDKTLIENTKKMFDETLHDLCDPTIFTAEMLVQDKDLVRQVENYQFSPFKGAAECILGQLAEGKKNLEQVKAGLQLSTIFLTLPMSFGVGFTANLLVDGIIISDNYRQTVEFDNTQQITHDALIMAGKIKDANDSAEDAAQKWTNFYWKFGLQAALRTADYQMATKNVAQWLIDNGVLSYSVPQEKAIIDAIKKYKYARRVQASSGPVIKLYNQSQDDSDDSKEQTKKDPE